LVQARRRPLNGNDLDFEMAGGAPALQSEKFVITGRDHQHFCNREVATLPRSPRLRLGGEEHGQLARNVVMWRLWEQGSLACGKQARQGELDEKNYFLPPALCKGSAAGMKNTFLSLLVAVACGGVALAQTSPAPDASHSLTKEERQRAIDYLKETQKNFLAAVDGVSDAQWKFKAAPDRWSIAETAEHIATAEDFIWARVNEMMKAPANPERRAETQGKDKLIYDKIPDRSRKAQAPEALKPTGKFATREELVKHFKEVRAKEIAFLEETTEDLRSHIADNPALDAMDAYQWVIFNGAHSKRHTAQIEEVKTNANYPKS
jgi:hypothetical protein